MYGETQNAMQCAEFEALLADVLDGALSGPKLESFRAHQSQCAACGPMYAETAAGLRWLEALDEVEPPAEMMANILAATSGLEAAQQPTAKSWRTRLLEWIAPVFTPVVGTMRQPRFAMSFGMAFFSISMVLSLTGVKVSDLRHVDLRPSALVRTYYETSGKIVKYYENIRFVYEVESRVREIKQATTPEEKPRPKEKPEKSPKDNTSGDPNRKQNENYSREQSRPIVAGLDALRWLEEMASPARRIS